MRKSFYLLLTVLCVSSTIVAQESAFVAEKQTLAVLPGTASSLSVVDSTLYCYSSQVLLAVQRSGRQIIGFWPDTTVVQLEDGINYVVRHPASSDIYFTRIDRHGLSILYQCIVREGKRAKVKKVKMDGMAVEHPTFSADGKIMVFASRERKGSYGSSDLWYSVLEDDKWSKPVNLGRRVNTRYDEVSPSMYGDYLIFASNGREAGEQSLDIYVTRLVSDTHDSDTVGMLQIGTQTVQRLPWPINDVAADDCELVVDTLHNCGYWLSSRDKGSIYSFAGTLDGMIVWGRVLDKSDKPLAGTRVMATQDGRYVCSTQTDSTGVYSLYLRRDQYYGITVYRDGYFTEKRNLNTVSFDKDRLFAEERIDIQLDGLPIGEVMQYDDLFGDGTDVNLSRYGREQLAQLIRFLHDNPSYAVSFSLSCDVSSDETYNMLLTEYRMKALKSYMDEELPAAVETSYRAMRLEAEGGGRSRLKVIVSRVAKKAVNRR